MGFISYHMKLYQCELRRLESGAPTPESIYHARQLIKILDDLADENYTELGEALENDCQGVTRLRQYLAANNARPFDMPSKPINVSSLSYEPQEVELSCALQTAMNSALSANPSDNPFIQNILRFCEWIGYDAEAAYIFLLRDTLLPYAYYRAHNRRHLYPWLLGRKAFEQMTGARGADDAVRDSIIDALENGRCRTFDELKTFALPRIRKTIHNYPDAESALRTMLDAIPQQRIIVIESGCSGTFPMLLMSLDARVDMRMYTTYPYMTGIYSGRIYTSRYEDNRLFETLLSQDAYLQFSDFRDLRFYVRTCRDKSVQKSALEELNAVMRIVRR